MACLTNPSSCVKPSPGSKTYLDDVYDIHLNKIAGIDINAEELDQAVRCTTTPDSDVPKSSWVEQEWVRWDDLEVKIWHGGLETFNSEFVYDKHQTTGYECIVSTEVSAKFLHSTPVRNTDSLTALSTSIPMYFLFFHILFLVNTGQGYL